MERINNLSKQLIATTTDHPYWVLGGLSLSALSIYSLNKYIAGGVCEHVVDLSGKNVIVTGSNTGIGKVNARRLAQMGAHVIVAGRNKKLCEEAVSDIKKRTNNNQVEYIQLDLSDFESIRKFANTIKERNLPIHILVNNAGLVSKFDRTKDGLELVNGVNHFGHFLLTNLLFDNLAQNNARVVNVSSMANAYGTIDFNSFRGDPATYSGWKAYTQSKLANILFSNELQRRFEQRGSKATSNALHPGAVYTDLYRNGVVEGLVMRLVGKTVEQGTETNVYCCIAPELEGVGGKYFADCKEAKPNPKALDVELAKKLWSVSEELTGLSNKKAN